jgi:hypothetical protein
VYASPERAADAGRGRESVDVTWEMFGESVALTGETFGINPGSRILNVAPPAPFELTSALPPCASAVDLTIANPSPVPPVPS